MIHLQIDISISFLELFCFLSFVTFVLHNLCLRNLGTTEKQNQVVVRAGLEPGTTGLQGRHPNHTATLPGTNSKYGGCIRNLLKNHAKKSL